MEGKLLKIISNRKLLLFYKSRLESNNGTITIPNGGSIYLLKMDLQSHAVIVLEQLSNQMNWSGSSQITTIMGNENTLPFIYILKPRNTQGEPVILKYNVNTNEFIPSRSPNATYNTEFYHSGFQDGEGTGYGVIVGDYFYIGNGLHSSRKIRKIHITNKTTDATISLGANNNSNTLRGYFFIEHYNGYLYIFKGGNVGSNTGPTIQRVNLIDDSLDSYWHQVNKTAYFHGASGDGNLYWTSDHEGNANYSTYKFHIDTKTLTTVETKQRNSTDGPFAFKGYDSINGRFIGFRWLDSSNQNLLRFSQYGLAVSAYQKYDAITNVQDTTVKYIKSVTSNKNLLGKDSGVAVDSFDFVGTNRIQSIIADGELTIAKTNGLQAALDSKQATITDGDLTIARTNGLQAALDSKQATITDGDLTIARTSGLQTALDLKQNTITSSTDISMNNLSVQGDISCNSTLKVDTINENTDSSGVTIDSVLLKDNQITAHTITAQNYRVGNVNFISASRQGNSEI